VQGAVMAKAGASIAIDTNPSKWEMAKALGPPTHHPREYDRPLQQVIVDLTDGGVINVPSASATSTMMRSRWNAATRAGANRSSSASPGAGQKLATRPFQLVTGRVWRGSAFGGVKGPLAAAWLCGSLSRRRNQRSTRWSAPRIARWKKSNEAFDLMHRWQGDTSGDQILSGEYYAGFSPRAATSQ